jgi:hypothetical protein
MRRRKHSGDQRLQPLLSDLASRVGFVPVARGKTDRCALARRFPIGIRDIPLGRPVFLEWCGPPMAARTPCISLHRRQGRRDSEKASKGGQQCAVRRKPVPHPWVKKTGLHGCAWGFLRRAEG